IVIAFNVDVLEEARQLLEKEKIPLIEDNLIFRLFEKINAYVDEYDRAQREKILKELILPAKIEVLSGFIFRRSKPAIVGVRVLSGVIRPNLQIINADGKVLGHIKSIQSEGKSLEEATAGMEVAISITDAVVGRDFDAGDVLYVDLPEEVARKINRDQNLKKMLPPGVLETFRELLEIKRKVYGFSWGL
ncbi:MAG: translation initiation factor IF-2, partial [Candidatus Korarchaeota archaeon]